MKTLHILLVTLTVTLLAPSCVIERARHTPQQVLAFNAMHLKNPNVPFPKGNLFITGEAPTIVSLPIDRSDNRSVPSLVSLKIGVQ